MAMLLSPIIVACILLILGYVMFRMLYHPHVKTSQVPGETFRSLQGKTDTEVIIIGSGVLGSALAATIGRDGRKVMVIERDLKEPDRIVGELLQPGGRRALEQLGLQDATEGIDAHTIQGYVLHDTLTHTQVHVPYPEDLGEGLSSGKAFHHGRFVMALRAAAQQQENVTYVEGNATRLVENEGRVVGVQYRPKDKEETEEIIAPLTIVADGCFSRFRKSLVKESPKVTSHFVGLLMQNCPQSCGHHAELVLMDPSPVLVYQISSDDTRILVDVRGPMPKDLKQHLADNVLPNLPEHMYDAFLDALSNGRIRSMPSSFLPAQPRETPGVLVLGDALNMRHPLTGGGMSVALNDVLIWRDLLRKIPDLCDSAAILDALSVFRSRRRGHHSFVVNVLAQALYELFASTDLHLKSLKNACIAYFKLGGECVNGPVGLLSVLNPKPHVLIGHFFAVAVYAIYTTVRQGGWAVHRTLHNSASILYKACGVLLPLILSEKIG